MLKIFFIQKCSNIFEQKIIIANFIFKSAQVHMNDAESVESKEKSNFRFSQFLFLEIWSFFVLKEPQFSMNFHDNSKNKNRKFFVLLFFILSSTHRIIHKDRIKTEIELPL